MLAILLINPSIADGLICNNASISLAFHKFLLEENR
jgi:hypothetical protein